MTGVTTTSDWTMVTKRDGSRWTFRASDEGLYYMVQDIKPGTGTALVTTVEFNKNKYTIRDQQRAQLARTIQRRIGRPSLRTYLDIVANNRLKNCPITRDDIIAAEHIWGPELGILKGKTVRLPSEQVRVINTPIPKVILERYRKVELAGDVMKVNGVPFLVTISCELKFGTTQHLKNQFMKTILAAIKEVNGIYRRRGFVITTMSMDGQFDSLTADLMDMGIALNSASNDEHVPVAERRIRTVVGEEW